MRSRDMFALAVRIIGLLAFIYALGSLPFIFTAGWFFVVRLIVLLVLSVWFVRGAPQLVQFAYRDGE